VKRKEKILSWRGIHSPFFFDLARHLEGGGKYVDIQYDKELVEKLIKIEGLRRQLLRSTDEIYVDDYGAGSRVFKRKSRKVKKIARHVLQSKKVAFALLRVLIFWRNKGSGVKILEMGTSLGLTTAYLAASGWEVETWEGCQQTANYARKNWKYLGCQDQIKCEVGTFKSLMDKSQGGWDVVFLDGHHDKDATLDYVETLKTKLRPGGAILVDDITWSQGMKEAWSELLEDSHWNATMTWRGKGWLFNRDGEIEQYLKLRKSYIPLSKFNKMKLFTIALAAVTLLMSTQVQAQATKEERNVKSKSASSMSSASASKIYGELQVSEVQGTTIVKIIFDNYLGKIEKFNPSLASVSEMSDFRYTSMGQALNILSSHGWSVDHVWTTMERTGTVQHLLVSHEVSGLSPLEPWLDKGAKRRASEARD
jgi:predicted O-methyltransferase YrrM